MTLFRGEKVTDYDSRIDTLQHIGRVQKYIADVIFQLAGRSTLHDKSKLEEPEKSVFDRETPSLKTLTYGSDEYQAALNRLGTALAHHYAKNDHHPEHYDQGIDGMSAIAIIEMLCDWKAASERHNDGSMTKSIEHNVKRFNIEPQLASILWNTAREMGWLDSENT